MIVGQHSFAKNGVERIIKLEFDPNDKERFDVSHQEEASLDIHKQNL